MKRFGLFVLFLICGCAVFFTTFALSPIMSTPASVIVRSSLTIVFILMSIVFYRNEPMQKYWQVFFAFFIASAALFISWLFSDLGLQLFKLELDSPAGIAMAKLSESLLIVIAIIVLTLVSGGSLGSIYLKAGKLGLGLIIGLLSFMILSVLAILQATAQGIQSQVLVEWLPWILIFVLCNGFMEELLFRGIFLQKYVPFLGRGLSNLVAALIFTIAHARITYSPDLPFFLAITFLLALAWGYVMQKTDSIIGAGLFHAGADMLIIIGVFANFGITG